jgi:putative ABC transport system permease protein
MDSLRQDIRHGLRGLTRQPGFAAVALATLALGIGANTAIFSVVNAVLLRPLPYRDPAGLVRLAEVVRTMRPGGGSRGAFVTGDTFQAWRESSSTLEALAAYAQRSYTLTGMGDPIRLRGTAVSSSMFRMLGASPERGRLFADGEDKAGADQVAIISDTLWSRQFRRAPDIVGRTIVLDDRQYTIVGVLPQDFYFPDRDSEIWTPMVINTQQARPGQRVVMAFAAIGRLRPGTPLSRAEAEGTAVAARIQAVPGARTPAGLPPAGMHLVPLQSELVANVRPALLVLTVAVMFVLLIAIANVANLQLARGAARQRELAVRTAIGAKRGRLVRQLLTESVLVGVVGGALGVVLALVLLRMVPVLAPAGIPRLDEASLDARVLAFAALLSIGGGLLFGLVPAVQGSRVNVLRTLNEAGAHRMGGFRFLKGNRVRSLLIVAEVALSIVLLAGAGLLIRSFVRLVDVDPGYDPANVVTAQISLPAAKYKTSAEQRVFLTQLLDRVSSISGVRAAGTTNMLPLLPGNMIINFGIEGQPRPASPQDMPRASVRIVSDGFAEAIGLKLVSGRFFSPHDTATTTPVAVVNQSAARQYFQGHAVGSRVQLFGPEPLDVVGEMRDVHHSGLDAAPQPEIYLLAAQVPAEMPLAGPGGTALVVRSAGDPLALVPFLRQAALDVDHDVPLDNVMTMDARLSASVAGPRLSAALLGAFAMLALVLAAIGLYGVLSYSVSQRHREIGVRMALGADRGDILRLVVRQGLVLVLAGVLLGVAGALGVTRFLETLLFGVSPNDPATYAAICALLVAVAFLACWIPARRASRVDPMSALRFE